MPRLNPAQRRLFERHVERAIEALREGDRLLKGAVADVVGRMETWLREEAALIDQEESRTQTFELQALPVSLVPYLEDPFAQALAFNLHCQRTRQSHTQGAKDWQGGPAAVAARNLLFLPPVFRTMWEEGTVDKTRLVAIANRNLTPAGYLEVADLVRTRRREDLDERLLRMPPGSIQLGRRGPEEAMRAAQENGWLVKLSKVTIPAELVAEAQKGQPAPAAEVVPDATDGAAPALTATPVAPPPPAPTAPAVDSASLVAQRALRAGLAGARLAPEVVAALDRSPDPAALVEKFLKAHRQSRDPDPAELTKTLFFAHAGVIQKLEADDKLLLRHFRPVKTQKRGQLFYRMLEVIEEAMLERQALPDLAGRGITEEQAMTAVRRVIVELNKDPNRFLEVPAEWLGELTRRHLYFGSRTRKEGAAYKWFRKIGPAFYLGSHKTREEMDERDARRAARKLAKGEEEE